MSDTSARRRPACFRQTGPLRSAGIAPVAFVADEAAWRIPQAEVLHKIGSGVQASRWQARTGQTRECSADTPPGSHVAKIVLRSMNMCLSVNGKTIQDGFLAPGMFHVTEPEQRTTALFRGPYDALHLYIPDRLISECTYGVPDQAAPSLRSTVPLIKDPLVESLGRALLDADSTHETLGLLYVDYISTALVARILHATNRACVSKRGKVSGLARWRLRRAIEFIEAGLDQPLSLADIAGACGLSRMHFAAQFRAATGLRPHEYMLRRRIERAQEMLIASEQAVVDVALSVGFQTQSHFTTTFKRFVGKTPWAWRQECAHTRAMKARQDRHINRNGQDPVATLAI